MIEMHLNQTKGAAVAAPPCLSLAGARYRSSYMDACKKTWTPWKTVGAHWGIARNHFSELSECWTKDTEWDFSGSHDLVWNELRGYCCFECGIPLPTPLGQERPPTAGNTHRGRKLNIEPLIINGIPICSDECESRCLKSQGQIGRSGCYSWDASQLGECPENPTLCAPWGKAGFVVKISKPHAKGQATRHENQHGN